MTQEFTIPLKISVSLGSPVLVTAEVSTEVTRGEAKRREMAADTVTSSAIESTESHIDRFDAASLTAKTFQWKTALSLALASRLAYGAAGKVEDTVQKMWGLDMCKFVEEDDTQCFIAASKKAVLVSFRGTENLGDWLANLSVLGTTRNYGRVHRGFLGAFQVVESQLSSILSGFSDRPVLLTGHSLGGALALIAAAEWRSKFQVKWVHTHGQPAAGKESFQKFFRSNYPANYYRFVNDADVVPRVPPFYSHAGRLFHFTGSGDLESGASIVHESPGSEVDVNPEQTPMMTEEQFNLMRAQLLQDKAMRAGAPLTKADVEHAAREATALGGTEGLEGFFPSVSDHRMDLYVAKIARQAGF